ncbi:MAG: AbrB/MazE/SpoVT family DNA-binding domain-containing protein [Phototrophicaceae bacterium]
MLAKIQKWGNSLALRIPKAFAEEAGLDNDSAVEIHVVDGQIHIVPIQDNQYDLSDLLADVTADNLHDEVDTGNAMGNEVW